LPITPDSLRNQLEPGIIESQEDLNTRDLLTFTLDKDHDRDHITNLHLDCRRTGGVSDDEVGSARFCRVRGNRIPKNNQQKGRYPYWIQKSFHIQGCFN
jgi:hypothetical protein